MKYQILNDHVEIEGIGKSKKITGTRFASILDLNAWSTPFAAWCDMTKLYKEPFEDTVYTIAGKVIEPKIIKYLNDEVYTGRVVDPETYFGKDHSKRRFDFWPHEPVFGGLWDALIINKKTGKPRAIVEIKTTKRAEDWEHDVPLYYKLQAMLYAKLEGVTSYVFAVAFLDDEIYSDPSQFIASDETVKVMTFELDDAFITQNMQFALEWYENHINRAISPCFDEKKDADILKELRTNRVEATETIDDFISTIDRIKPIVEANDQEMKEYTDKLIAAEDGLKAELVKRFTDQDNTVSITTSLYEFRVNRSIKEEQVFDEKRFKKEHPDLHVEYSKTDKKVTVRKQIKALGVINE